MASDTFNIPVDPTEVIEPSSSTPVVCFTTDGTEETPRRVNAPEDGSVATVVRECDPQRRGVLR